MIPKELKNFYRFIKKNCLYCPDGQYTEGWGIPGNILFIGGSPEKRKIENIKFERFLISLLWKTGIKPDDLFFTTLSKVYIDPTKGKVSSKIQHQWRHIKDEIALIKPEIIISYGSLADKILTRERILHYPIIHPGAVQNGSITEDEWIEQLVVIINKYIKNNG